MRLIAFRVSSGLENFLEQSPLQGIMTKAVINSIVCVLSNTMLILRCVTISLKAELHKQDQKLVLSDALVLHS